MHMYNKIIIHMDLNIYKEYFMESAGVRFQQFHISFRFLFQVLAFEIFHVIFDRSIVINKPFLAHVFKLQHLQKLKISLKKWNTASRMKITLLRLIHQKTWYSAPHWTYHFARTWKSDTRHLIGYCVLRPGVNFIKVLHL